MKIIDDQLGEWACGDGIGIYLRDSLDFDSVGKKCTVIINEHLSEDLRWRDGAVEQPEETLHPDEPDSDDNDFNEEYYMERPLYLIAQRPDPYNRTIPSCVAAYRDGVFYTQENRVIASVSRSDSDDSVLQTAPKDSGDEWEVADFYWRPLTILDIPFYESE